MEAIRYQRTDDVDEIPRATLEGRSSGDREAARPQQLVGNVYPLGVLDFLLESMKALRSLLIRIFGVEIALRVCC